MPRHPRHARTAQRMSDDVYSRLTARARALGGKVYPLHVGDTWLEPPESARAEAQTTSEHPRLHNYAEVRGEPMLLDAIAAWHDDEVSRGDVQVVSGGTVGLSVICQAFLEPGDEVLLPAPFWPLVRGLVSLRGATPVEIPFYDRLDAPGFDAEAVLEAAVTERTVAVYLNTPHNPTGRVLSEEVLQAAIRVAERHDLWIFTDEAYERLAFGPVPPPLWSRPEVRERVIATHTLSKSHGMAGARIGYVHGPSEAMAVVRGVQTYVNYCAARPMQIAAARALAEGDDWVESARALYAESGRMAARALDLPEPEGGTFLFFDAGPYLREGEDVPALLERCLEAGVLLTPGSACGRDYDRFLRLCFTSVAPAELRAALDRLRGVLGR